MKHILITGARSGLMHAVIEKLKQKDVYLYVTVHTEKQLQRVKERYQENHNIECFKLDITDPDDLKKLEQYKIDVLINNAAIGIGGSIAEMPLDDVRTNFEVNVFSSFEVIQRVLKPMIDRQAGKIIIIGSLAGIIPLPFLGSYCATKASIHILARTLKEELKLIPSSPSISLIEPGLYHTGFNQVMLEDKYDWMKKKSYFKEELELIRRRENLLIHFLEKQKFDSIVNKIITSIFSSNNHFLYRAPFFQTMGAKLYQIFWN